MLTDSEVHKVWVLSCFFWVTCGLFYFGRRWIYN